MSRHLRPTGIALGLILLCGCQQDASPPAVTDSGNTAGPVEAEPIPALAPLGDYRLLEVRLGRAVDAEGRVTEPLGQFAASDTLYLSALGGSSSAALTLSAHWQTDAGAPIARSEQALTAGPATVATFSLSHPTGWPNGQYRVELALNGQPVDHREFEVR